MDEARILAWLDGIRFAVQRPERKFRLGRRALFRQIEEDEEDLRLLPERGTKESGEGCLSAEGEKRQKRKKRVVPDEEQTRRILPIINFFINATGGAGLKMDGLAVRCHSSIFRCIYTSWCIYAYDWRGATLVPLHQQQRHIVTPSPSIYLPTSMHLSSFLYSTYLSLIDLCISL